MSDRRDFDASVEGFKSGRLLIGVDRGKARHFFMQVPAAYIKERTGDSLVLERAVIWGLYLLAALSILASVVIAGFAFRWLAILVIPVIAFTYMFNMAKSVYPNSGLGVLTFL